MTKHPTLLVTFSLISIVLAACTTDPADDALAEITSNVADPCQSPASTFGSYDELANCKSTSPAMFFAAINSLVDSGVTKCTKEWGKDCVSVEDGAGSTSRVELPGNTYVRCYWDDIRVPSITCCVGGVNGWEYCRNTIDWNRCDGCMN